MIAVLIVLLGLGLAGGGSGLNAQVPDYDIHAIRYGTITGFPVSTLVGGADESERMDVAMVFWLIQGGGRQILFDSGFHRAAWFERFEIKDYLPPDQALQLAGVDAEDVTDVIVSHAHWDHLGGIDLFPDAMIWIQRDEFRHYVGQAWQNGARGGGSDPDDLLELVARNTRGLVRLVEGDSIEILPGIRVFTGARHTLASQYVRVAGNPAIVLASDNAYLYRNLTEHRPVATFTLADTTANLRALARMVRLAGGEDNVIPGHDPLQFQRYPTQGRVARIR